MNVLSLILLVILVKQKGKIMAINLMEVIQNKNIDNITIKFKSEMADGKPVNKLESKVIFGKEHSILEGIQLANGKTVNLLFTPVVNHTKGGRKISVVTGYQIDGIWYGDRPNAGDYRLIGETGYWVKIDGEGNFLDSWHDIEIEDDE